MSQPLVLSLFPGIGLLDMAFEQEGFCVVRGPDVLWGGDIRRFHPPAGVFDGVIGGPPCKPFSRLVHMVRANGYEVAPDLIPEFARVVREASPDKLWDAAKNLWYVMENVPGSHPPFVGAETYRIDNRHFGAVQRRERLIYANVRLQFDVALFEAVHWEPVVSSDARPTPVAMAHYANGVIAPKSRDLMKRRTVAEMCELQGLPVDYLNDAPFTESGKREAIGNGVPLPMGRAIARAVKRAMGYPMDDAA